MIPPSALRSCLAILIVVSSLGCATDPVNPSFHTTTFEAKVDLHRISASPKPLDRPVVVIGGIFDPFIGTLAVKWQLEPLTTDRRIIEISMIDCLSFDSCRAKVIDAVERSFPSDSKTETAEVDVIGLSMGGLVARYSALPVAPGEHHKRLKIARLFTISSPLSGAYMADHLPAIYPLFAPMRSDSDVVKEVNAKAPVYPIYSYVRLHDWPVGITYAAAKGATPWWLSTPPMETPHVFAFWDPRIIADIARRLRGETPLASDPPAPLPAAG